MKHGANVFQIAEEMYIPFIQFTMRRKFKGYNILQNSFLV